LKTAGVAAAVPETDFSEPSRRWSKTCVDLSVQIFYRISDGTQDALLSKYWEQQGTQ
jgi:hypothetical protein